MRLQVRSCGNPDCPRHRICLRPEQEGQFAPPQSEFGLDVIALVGVLRHAEHRSIPEIHAELACRGVLICVRSVGNLLDRYYPGTKVAHVNQHSGFDVVASVAIQP